MELFTTRLRRGLPWALLVLISVLPVSAEVGEGGITAGVVKLEVYSDPPNLTLPWQYEGAFATGGSGVIIEGNRILTNAHVVEDAVSIEVKRADGSRKFPARVTFISHDADLALVEVQDKRFFEGARALSVGSMPELQQEVAVYGFPEGGESLSITSGVVSRVEVGAYSHGGRSLLFVQIDAAINGGNSGGPVVSQGSIVGIAMQTLDDAENVGDMIPPPVIQHFLEDVADGHYDGFPRLGAQLQNMSSDAQRRAAGVGEDETGALVLRVDYGGPAHGVLRPRDVIVAIDGRSIAEDLTVSWSQGIRVHYSALLQAKQAGQTISVSILREGKRLRKTVQLRPHRPLVPGRRTTDRPRYLVFGGLVFQPFSEDYFDYFEGPPSNLDSVATSKNFVTKQRREVILIQTVLPADVNRGYQDWADKIVRLVNGQPPRDMNHLAFLIDGAKGPWLRIVTEDGSLLTMDIKAAREAQESILDYHGVTQDRYLATEPRLARTQRRRRR